MLITQAKLIGQLADGTRTAAEIAAAVTAHPAPVSRSAVIGWIARHNQDGKLKLQGWMTRARGWAKPQPVKPKVERRAPPYPHQKRTRKPIAKAPAPAPEVPTTPTASLIELGPLSCRWPMWKHHERPPHPEAKSFCGREAENIDGKPVGQLYCRAHKHKEWERAKAQYARG